MLDDPLDPAQSPAVMIGSQGSGEQATDKEVIEADRQCQEVDRGISTRHVASLVELQ